MLIINTQEALGLLINALAAEVSAEVKKNVEGAPSLDELQDSLSTMLEQADWFRSLVYKEAQRLTEEILRPLVEDAVAESVRNGILGKAISETIDAYDFSGVISDAKDAAEGAAENRAEELIDEKIEEGFNEFKAKLRKMLS